MLIRRSLLCRNCLINHSKLSSNEAKQPEVQSTSTPKVTTLQEQQRRERVMKISNSMMVYLKAVHEKQMILENEQDIFDRGKRHLANIMGFDLETLTQQQIDGAIRYLLPSGLFDKKALPLMRPPAEVIPKMRVIDVDESGWPKHTLFYTLRPNFYSILSDMSRRTQNLVQAYDKRQLLYFRGKISAEEAKRGNPISNVGFRWLTKEELEDKFGREQVTDKMYAGMIMALEYMTQLPNASEEAEFLEGYRTPIIGDRGTQHPIRIFHPRGVKRLIPEVKIDETGRRYATGLAKVKATRMMASVYENGTGELTVNGHHYDVFRDIQAREILLAPMIITGLLGKIDVRAQKIEGPGGKSVTPRAVRHAISLALVALYPNTLAERLRTAGLLCPDLRRREREKINQPGARAKWIWKRR